MTKEEKELNIAVFKALINVYDASKDRLGENFRLINERAKQIVSTLESGGDIPDEEMQTLTRQINTLKDTDFEAN